MAQYIGIDVSKHQGKIDWTKVKAAGVQFAMLRAGYGRYDNQKDEQFEANYKGATAAGIPVGAYHYSYATTAEQAKQEAEVFLGWIKGKNLTYPVAFDIEDKKQANLGVSVISDIICAFCEAVEAAGYYVVVYANKDWLTNRIDADCKSRYDIWLAQWTSQPTYTGSYGMWQYTSDGAVDGISGRVDMNIAYKDYPSIIAGMGGSDTTASTPTDTAKKTNAELAVEVIAGKWGNGNERKQRLTAAGYDYNAVQAIVNKLVQTATETIDVEYQTYTDSAWLDWVENYNEKNSDGYAGIQGKAATAIRVGLSKGHIQYRAHTVGGKWYSWITDYNTKDTNGYAGVLGKEMDMLQMTLTDLPGYAIEYRVSTVGGDYLPWVRDYNTVNSDGYAGLTGKPIDRVQIRIVKV